MLATRLWVQTLPEALANNLVYLILEWLCCLHLGRYIPVNEMRYAISEKHVGHEVMVSNPARGIGLQISCT